MTNKEEKRGRKKSPYRKDAFIISRVHQEHKDILLKIANKEGIKLSKLIDYMIEGFIETHAEKEK